MNLIKKGRQFGMKKLILEQILILFLAETHYWIVKNWNINEMLSILFRIATSKQTDPPKENQEFRTKTNPLPQVVFFLLKTTKRTRTNKIRWRWWFWLSLIWWRTRSFWSSMYVSTEGKTTGKALGEENKIDNVLHHPLVMGTFQSYIDILFFLCDSLGWSYRFLCVGCEVNLEWRTRKRRSHGVLVTERTYNAYVCLLSHGYFKNFLQKFMAWWLLDSVNQLLLIICC